MLEKIIGVDQIEVVESGCVQVRTATKIMDDGQELSRTYHRHVIAPGEDYSQEELRVQAICAAVHTAAVVAAYQAKQQSNKVEA